MIHIQNLLFKFLKFLNLGFLTLIVLVVIAVVVAQLPPSFIDLCKLLGKKRLRNDPHTIDVINPES